MKSSSSQRGLRLLLLTLLGLVIVFALLVRSTFRAPTPGQTLGIDRLYRLAANGQIVSARLLDEDAQVVGRWCPAGPLAGPARTCAGPLASFHSAYPRSDVTTQSLIDRVGATAPVVVDPQSSKAVARLVLTFVLPLVILANLFGLIFLSRGGDNSLADIAGFGRLGRKRQRQRTTSTGITFADVAGVGDAVAELREVIDYLTDPSRFQAYGAVAPKGVLLFGPPGCGKTLLARAVAGESGVPFLSVSGTEFVESLVGVGAARVRDLFSQVRELAPAIVFIDEVDAVGRRREGEGVSGGEREQTLNQLLVELDGFEVTSGIVVMGATNRPDILDPALLRPGRFDRHVTLEPPDVDGRRDILAIHARGRPIAADVDWAEVATRTPGFTGADLANVVNEAALLTVRQGSPGAQITAHHVSEAIQRVLHGPHRGKLLSAAERRRLAVHEGGHAVVAAAVGRAESLHRVSIVARGRGLGRSVLAGDDRALSTVADMEDELAMAMAGVAAEVEAFGVSSTTAEDDIEQASVLARQMVGLYGMSTRVGRIRVMSPAGGFLGGSVALEAVSEHTLGDFDTEVKRLVDAAEARAGAILDANWPVLERMVSRLESEETLEGAALAELVSAVRDAPSLPSANGSSSPRSRAAAGARTRS
jgi:cell division protease FtsH